MSQPRNAEQGFTAVELVVALIVGVLLLGSAYQLYATIVSTSGDTQRRALASNAAYALLRDYQTNSGFVGNPCVAHSDTPTMPAWSSLPSATATVAITCPFTSADLNLITVTVEYSNASSTERVSRAILIKAD